MKLILAKCCHFDISLHVHANIKGGGGGRGGGVGGGREAGCSSRKDKKAVPIKSIEVIGHFTHNHCLSSCLHKSLIKIILLLIVLSSHYQG